jgi:hypothetical protein
VVFRWDRLAHPGNIAGRCKARRRLRWRCSEKNVTGFTGDLQESEASVGYVLFHNSDSLLGAGALLLVSHNSPFNFVAAHIALVFQN